MSLHLTLGELAICCEEYWFGAIEKRSEIGIVAQVTSSLYWPALPGLSHLVNGVRQL